MTDFYGQILEVEEVNDRYLLRVTGDRSRILCDTLNVLGFGASMSETDAPAMIDALDPTDPGEDYLAFSPGTDPNLLQDMLDQLDYRSGGEIVRRVV